MFPEINKEIYIKNDYGLKFKIHSQLIQYANYFQIIDKSEIDNNNSYLVCHQIDNNFKTIIKYIKNNEIYVLDILPFINSGNESVGNGFIDGFVLTLKQEYLDNKIAEIQKEMNEYHYNNQQINDILYKRYFEAAHKINGIIYFN